MSVRLATAHRQANGARSLLDRLRVPAVALVLCAGVAAAVGAFAFVRGVELQRIRSDFGDRANAVAVAVQRMIEQDIELLQSVGGLYAASHSVEREEFRAFVRRCLPTHPEIPALDWLPRVPAAERGAFEERVRAEGWPGFEIRDLDTSGRLVRAGSRDEFFPVYYTEPFEQHARLLGVDSASQAIQREAMERARDLGRPVATGRISLVRVPGAPPGLIIFLPVYRNGFSLETVAERRQQLVGFVAMFYECNAFMKRALKGIALEGLDLHLLDDSAEAGERLLFSLDEYGAPEQAQAQEQKVRSGISYVASFFVAGRPWSLLCYPEPGEAFARANWRAAKVLMVGLALVLLLGGYLFLALRRTNQIERVVAKRTAELEAVKSDLEGKAVALEMANARFRALSVLKDEFVAKVSHELRTPLTSIKEGLSLLIDNALGETNAEQQDFLKIMDADVDRLAALINNMLDVSKIEAGRMRLTRVRVDLHELIDSLVRSSRPILGSRTIRHGLQPVPPVFVDRERTLQVLTNLLSNALKYTPDDGSITIRLRQADGMVSVAVVDAGCGIAPEDLPKIFQKFSQVGPQGDGRPRGTGLGLVLCKELAELHGGRIDVASELGRGTTFTVWLPMYTDRFALSASLQELLSHEGLGNEQGVGVLAIQAKALLDAERDEAQRQPSLQRVADDIRRHLHRGDIVLPIDPSWVLVLAVTEPRHLPAIAKRLQEKVRDGDRLQWGGAVYPADGADATALFERAAQRVTQGLDRLMMAAGNASG
ncbi:MAG: CHASE domain-containing protein [Candidatus Omnitrophica bacterium]|nr:CHASE domain-containing protein [Candidatus Omnitrophota bacterium]